MYSRVWIFLIFIQSTSINKVVSDQDFCKIQSNICVRFCPTTKQDHDWKPAILKKAERNGTGKSLDLNPNCNLTNLFIIDSRKPEFDIDIISNGNLSWGKEALIFKICIHVFTKCLFPRRKNLAK